MSNEHKNSQGKGDHLSLVGPSELPGPEPDLTIEQRKAEVARVKAMSPEERETHRAEIMREKGLRPLTEEEQKAHLEALDRQALEAEQFQERLRSEPKPDALVQRVWRLIMEGRASEAFGLCSESDHPDAGYLLGIICGLSSERKVKAWDKENFGPVRGRRRITFEEHITRAHYGKRAIEKLRCLVEEDTKSGGLNWHFLTKNNEHEHTATDATVDRYKAEYRALVSYIEKQEAEESEGLRGENE